MSDDLSPPLDISGNPEPPVVDLSGTDVSGGPITTTDISGSDISGNPEPPVLDNSGTPIFKWSITTMTVMPIINDLSNVVITVGWTYSLTYLGFTKILYGALELDKPDPNSYTPYNELTEEEVISWLSAKLNVDDFQQNLLNQVNQEFVPRPTILPIPWLQ